MAEEYPVGSPEYYRERLLKSLRDEESSLKLLEDYYAGKQRLAFSTEKFSRVFGSLFSTFADNWCSLVVDAVEERLNVEGFRFGDNEGDDDAWRIWQRNNLDAYSQIAHTEALINGASYLMVWPEKGELGQPAVITVEHPRQVIVESEYGNHKVRKAALKQWQEEDGHLAATLYMPDAVYKWRSEKPYRGATDTSLSIRWVKREVKGERWPIANPLGVVPVVPLYNRPRLLTLCESEIASVIPVQDAVNKLIADMLVAAEFAAFRQRWATGLEIPTDPETDQPIEPFKQAIDRLWISESENTQFGEFGESNLTNYVSAVEMHVQHIASQTRTPPHYFYLKGDFPSGESIKAAETGLVAKAKRKMRHFGEAHEEAMRLALKAENNAKSEQTGAETIWGDPESRSESEHVDAVMKMQALGVPQEALWEKLGATQEEIKRWKQMRLEEGLSVESAFNFEPETVNAG